MVTVATVPLLLVLIALAAVVLAGAFGHRIGLVVRSRMSGRPGAGAVDGSSLRLRHVVLLDDLAPVVG